MNIFKKAAKKGKDATIDTTKQVVHELGEIAKDTGKQVVGDKKDYNNDSSVAEAMQQKSVTDSGFNQQKEEIESKKKLDYLEKELEELRKKRLQEDYQKKLEEESESGEDKKQALKPPPVLPVSPKKGPLTPGGRKTKGTGEMISSKK